MNWLLNIFNFKKKAVSHDLELSETGEELHLDDKNKAEYDLDIYDNTEENIYISIGSTSIKVISTSEMINNKCKLNWLEEIDLGPLDGKFKGQSVDNLYSVVNEALEKVKDKLMNHKKVFISLPAQGVFFKNIELPKIDNRDMLLEAEIKKSIPIPFEDVLFANNVIWEKNNKEMHLCVVMQNEYIKKFEEVFNVYNIKPYFEVETFSLARVLTKTDKIKCVVNIGAEHTLFVFIQNGIVVSVSQIEYGSANINLDMKLKTEISFEDAENLKINFKKLVENKLDSAGVIEDFILDFSKNIAKDISNTVLNFEREYNIAVAEIAVCGGGSVVPNLKENILDNFEGHIIVKKLNSQNIILDNANNLHEENIPRFAQCIGLVLMQI